jgi:electron transfer flavoprotein beta subunit
VLIAVCLEWVDLAPVVDPRTGEVTTDARTSGTTLADAAALEWALRVADAWEADLLAVTVGPAGADAVLRAALAAGAHRAVRIVAPMVLDAASVAAALAPVLVGADLVLCGDQGAIGGSGAVPALLAHHRTAAPALGVVELELGARGELRATRRLDGGRRERLAVAVPAVVSLEGATARLRRGSLRATLAADRAPIMVRPFDAAAGDAGGTPVSRSTVSRRGPLRPRARELAAPAGAEALDRVRLLIGAGDAASAPSRQAPVVLEPADAADRILDALAAWGYPLPATDHAG